MQVPVADKRALVLQAGKVTKIVDHTMWTYGMKLYFTPGKTAVLFTVNVNSKREVLTDIWRHQSAGIKFNDTDRGLVPVRQ